MTYDPQLTLVDSFPLPICLFGRAYRCRKLRKLAAFRHDKLTKQTFYNLHAHVRDCYPRVIVALALTPSNVHDTRRRGPTEQFSDVLLKTTTINHPN